MTLLGPPRWGEIDGRPSWRGATVVSTSPLLVRLDGDDSGINARPAWDLVGGMSINDRVYVQIVDRQLVVLGRREGAGGAGWTYDVPSTSAGWVTVARHNGDGRTHGTFEIINAQSGEHDMLVLDVSVAFSEATIVLRSYNCYGRSSPVISAARYLNDSADAIYGPGILQVKLEDAATNWTVRCIQNLSPRLEAWEPMGFDTSTSGYNTTPKTQVGCGITDWRQATLQNGWVSSPSYAPVRYRMLPGSRVVIDGICDGPSATATTMLTLPVGYRPEYQHQVGVIGTSNNIYRLDVTTAGAVTSSIKSYTSLCGVSFSAFQ